MAIIVIRPNSEHEAAVAASKKLSGKIVYRNSNGFGFKDMEVTIGDEAVSKVVIVGCSDADAKGIADMYAKAEIDVDVVKPAKAKDTGPKPSDNDDGGK